MADTDNISADQCPRLTVHIANGSQQPMQQFPLVRFALAGDPTQPVPRHAGDFVRLINTMRLSVIRADTAFQGVFRHFISATISGTVYIHTYDRNSIDFG